MHREKCRLCFKKRARGILLLFCTALSCIGPVGEHPAIRPVQFGVVDVGEGLAQIVKAESRAVLFDMGSRDQFEKWKNAYGAMGSPAIAAIVISHNHDDHYGGLAMLDSNFNWTGLMVTSPYQDTSFLRGIMPRWNERLRFRITAANDTLALLDKVTMRCLWPPFDPDPPDSFSGDSANRYSLVVSIEHGDATALISSDIDSIAETMLSLREKTGLFSDIFVVPHHGSDGSLNPVFFGYINPSIAVISFGATNDYGHPSPSVLTWLSQMGVCVRMTAIDGTCLFESNGYYWK